MSDTMIALMGFIGTIVYVLCHAQIVSCNSFSNIMHQYAMELDAAKLAHDPNDLESTLHYLSFLKTWRASFDAFNNAN
jgi:hypothetical protein